jgi:hypothetical protein
VRSHRRRRIIMSNTAFRTTQCHPRTTTGGSPLAWSRMAVLRLARDYPHGEAPSRTYTKTVPDKKSESRRDELSSRQGLHEGARFSRAHSCSGAAHHKSPGGSVTTAAQVRAVFAKRIMSSGKAPRRLRGDGRDFSSPPSSHSALSRSGPSTYAAQAMSAARCRRPPAEINNHGGGVL